MHFLRTEKYLSRSLGTLRCSLRRCLPMEEDRYLCSTTRWCKCLSVNYITCIAQVTLIFINSTILIYNRWFSLLFLQFLLAFVTNKNRLDDCVNLLAKIFELFVYQVSRCLIFERQDYSDNWTVSWGRYRLSAFSLRGYKNPNGGVDKLLWVFQPGKHSFQTVTFFREVRPTR